jgi:mono/diheme cytochrome c family protein
MKRISTLKPLILPAAALAISSAVLCSFTLPAWAAETKAEPKAPPPKEKVAAPAKKKLTGAELYTINCARCHPERYATEFTAAQWKTIMLQMRVRANLPAAQAKEILKYLQEDSGTP